MRWDLFDYYQIFNDFFVVVFFSPKVSNKFSITISRQS